MKIAQYVQSLLPRIAKSDISKNLEDLRVELRDQTLAPYTSAIEVFDTWRFQTAFAKDFEKLIAKEVPSRIRGNYVDVVHEALTKTLDNVSTLEKLVNKFYGKDVVSKALSYSEAQLLQYIETISFAAKYARKLLIHTMALEIDAHRKRPTTKSRMTPAEERWLINNKTNFVIALRAMNHDSRAVQKVFESIPDIEVDESNVANVVANVGHKKLDPFGLNTQGIMLNPIYHIRVAYVDWQVARYEAAKEERRMLEFQILDMRNAMEGKDDPKLEQALEYTEDRLSRLNYKIEEIEEEAA